MWYINYFTSTCMPDDFSYVASSWIDLLIIETIHVIIRSMHTQ